MFICYRFFVKNYWFRICVQSILPWLQNANKKPGSTLFPTVYVYDQFMTMQVNSESIASLRFLEFKHLHCLVTNHWMMSTSKLATLFDVSQSSCTGAGSQCYQAVYKVIIFIIFRYFNQVLLTVPIAKTISVKNAPCAWVSMVSYLNK